MPVTPTSTDAEDGDSPADIFDRFAAQAAHDVRAPLRHIRCFAELIAADVSTERYADLPLYSDHIGRSAARLERLTVRVLEFARLAWHEIAPTDFPVSRCLEEVLAELARPIADSGARIQIENDATLRADYRLCKSLLVNLLCNALTYVEPDRAPDISIAIDSDASAMRISIADRGIGIEPRHAERIFEPFHRLHTSEETYHGVGLGLAMCRRIAEAHGGKIMLDTAYSGGARLIVTLPHAAE